MDNFSNKLIHLGEIFEQDGIQKETENKRRRKTRRRREDDDEDDEEETGTSRGGFVNGEAEEVDDDIVREEEREAEDLDEGENGIFPDDLDQRKDDSYSDSDVEEIINN